MDTQFVTIATYHNSVEAQLAATCLEAAKIPTVLLDDSMNRFTGGALEVRLQVPAEFENQAIEILRTEADLDV